jgi:hypothetical protein
MFEEQCPLRACSPAFYLLWDGRCTGRSRLDTAKCLSPANQRPAVASPPNCSRQQHNGGAQSHRSTYIRDLTK